MLQGFRPFDELLLAGLGLFELPVSWCHQLGLKDAAHEVSHLVILAAAWGRREGKGGTYNTGTYSTGTPPFVVLQLTAVGVSHKVKGVEQGRRWGVRHECGCWWGYSACDARHLTTTAFHRHQPRGRGKQAVCPTEKVAMFAKP